MDIAISPPRAVARRPKKGGSMSIHREFSRRRLLQTAGAVGLAAGVLPYRAAQAKDVVAGFIYVGPRDDFGYNQAHAEGAAAVKKMAGVKVLEEERVPETIEVQKTME